MIELFDKRFVHFMWDDELEGKEGFLADDIGRLFDHVNGGDREFSRKVHANLGSDFDARPFCSPNGAKWRFFYYDPNYEVKAAFNEGKIVQFRYGSTNWQDNTSQSPCWDDEDREWRVKPEEKKWIVYLARPTNGHSCYLTSCREDDWGVGSKGV